MFRPSVLLGVLTVAWGISVGAAAAAEASPNSRGRKGAGSPLTAPRDQRAAAWADLRDKKAVVVVFLGTECPVNNAFLPTLAELHRQYAPKGVQFLGVNANLQDTPERVAAHARKHALPFPVLKDPGNAVADRFGARRTPQPFL